MIKNCVDNSEKQDQENSDLTSIQGMSVLLQILHSVVE